MGTLTNIIKTVFTSTGAETVTADTEKLGRAQTRLGNTSAGTSRQFAAQSSGLGGLVAAYAGAAATAFALEASFSALARSARSLQTMEGLSSLAATAGQDANTILESIRSITKGQLTMTESASQINLALSAGFNSDQIEGLATVALKASRALGRDLADSMTRVVRGSAKLESELIDELGIFTKIGPSTAAYAAALGKNRLALTEFERRQAFVNSVIEEGNRKFKAINITVPTTAEKIEAFGVKILDTGTKIGMFLADSLAPLADFLTNNLAGAFAAVGLAIGLLASKGIGLLKDKLNSFATTIDTTGGKVEKFFLKYSAAAVKAREEAQKAIGDISLSKGMGRASQAELKKLKEQAQLRTLTGSEVQKATSLLIDRSKKLADSRVEEEASIKALKQSKDALAAEASTLKGNSAALSENVKKAEANTKALEAKMRALESTKTKIKETASALESLNKTSTGAASGIARAASTMTTGFLGLGSSIMHSASSAVAFAGSAMSVISVLSLVGSAIASAIGKQDEYNALLAKAGSVISSFFTAKSTKSVEKAFTSLTANALSELEKVDPKLRDLDSFSFETKILGIEVDVVKTKEDLIKEVTSAMTEASTIGKKTFGEQISDSAVGIGAGALLGKSIGSAAGVAIGKTVGTSLGSLAGPIGSAVGLVLGAGIGYGVDKLLSSDDTITVALRQQIEAAFGPDVFSGDRGVQLGYALQNIEKQAGAAKDLSFEGRAYYETQLKLAVQLSNNLDNIQQTQQVAERLGTDLAQLQDTFLIEIDKSSIKLSPNLSLDIPVKLSVIDQTSILKIADDISAAMSAAMTANEKLSAISPTQPTYDVMGNFSGVEDVMPVIIKSIEDIEKAQEANNSKLALYNKELENTKNINNEIVAERMSVLSTASYSELAAFNERLVKGRATEAALVEKINTALVEQSNLQRGLAITKSTDVATVAIAPYQDFRDALLDTGSALYTAQISTVQYENALSSLFTGIDSKTLSLETLVQSEGAVVSTLRRATSEASEVDKELIRLRASKIALENIGATTEVAAAAEAISLLEKEATTLDAVILLQQKRYQALKPALSEYEKQLLVLDKIKKTFGEKTDQPVDKYGDLDKQGTYIVGSINRQLNQYKLINEELSITESAYNKIETQANQVKEAVKNRSDAELLVTQYSRLTAQQFKDQAAGSKEILGLLGNIVTVTSDDLVTAEKHNTLLNVRANLTRELGDKLYEDSVAFTKSVVNQISQINNELANLKTQDNIAKLQFNIDMMGVKAQGVQAAYEFEQAFKDNQIKLIELQVENKKTTPTDGAEQINEINASMLADQRALIEIQRAAAQEQYMAEVKLQLEEYKATKLNIENEAKALLAKFTAEYKLLQDAATIYASIAGQMSTALVEAGNAIGQAIVDAANSAAGALGSAFGPMGKLLGIGANIAEATFKPQPVPQAPQVNVAAGGFDSFVSSMTPIQESLLGAQASMRSITKTVEDSTKTQLSLAEEEYNRKNELGMLTRAEQIRDFDRQVALLAQKELISKEEAEKRLREAGAGGGGSADKKLSEIDKKLQALFDSLKSNLESALMSLNNLVLYGEGSFSEIASNFFKTIQQDFFKQTIAQPLSDSLTKGIFGALGVGVTQTKGEKGLTFNASDNSLLVRVVNAAEIAAGSGAGGLLNSPKSDDPNGTGVSGWMGKLFGKEGTIAGLFSNLFGEGGILSNLINGFGSFLGTIFKAIFGGIFGGGMVTGGAVHMAQGGVAGASALNRDRIPALLEPGEFVVRKPVARMVGTPALNSLNATGRMPGGAAPTINFKNEGTAKEVQTAQPKFDGEKYVIDIILRDLSNNGPIRKSLRGGSI